MAHKWEIDYRPSYGGRVHAIKYQFTHKEVRIRQPYRVWINSGYWKYYMTHYHVDTSHWETRTRKVWVDNSYIVKKGHWEYRNEKVLIKDGYYKTYTAYRWVDKSYYKTEKTWVNDGYYAESLHGNVTVIKNPEYVFTKWHKDNNGNESCMELKITWAIENGKIKKIKVYEELQRYDGKGIENIDIIDSKINLKAEGSISKTIKFEHPGSKSSKLHIYLYGEDGRVAHVYCSNPVNGFHSINIEKNGTEKNADKWLGGNSYGKIEI